MTQYSGVYTLQQQGQALTTGQWATEPYAKNNTLLLHADGAAGGAQNNTFIDSSTNNFTITRNGTPTQGTFTPYIPYGSTYSPSGANVGYVQYAYNGTSILAQGTAQTIEGWFYMGTAATGNTASTANPILSTSSSSSSASNGHCYLLGSTAFVFLNNSGASYQTISWTPPLNTWFHLAFVTTNGTNYTLYINGTSVGTYTDGTSWFNDSTYNVYVGATQGNGTSLTPNAYFSNIRITKSAVYTSNFTPSTTPLTAISGTTLLTAQSNRIVDNSSLNLTPTILNNPNPLSVQRFNPFVSQYQYTSTVFGGSGFYNGSSDYLTFAPGSATVFGTGNFTVECWVYATTYPHTNGMYFIDGRNSGQTTGFTFYFGSGNGINFGGPSTSIGNTSIYSANTWYHVAYVKNGSTGTIYVNGVSAATGTDNNNYTTSLTTAYIGSRYSVVALLQGYMTDFRVVKGTAVYTSTFTPPTAPLTAITNTTVLLSYQNAGIVDSAMSNDFVTVGSAQVSTSVYKYGSGSLYFNGSTDYLSTANKPLFNFGTGDFTVECWVNLTTPAGTTYGYQVVGKSNGSTGWAILVNRTNTGYSVVATSTDGSSLLLYQLGTLLATTWYHIAWSRTSGTAQLFLNGIVVASASDTSSDTNTNTLWVASQNGGQLFPGYIDDLRITNGYGRYTSNFTPPLVAFANQ
jgi:hypothetical protein